MNQIRTAALFSSAVRPGAVDDTSRVPGSRSGNNSAPSELLSVIDVYARLNAVCACRGGKQRLADRAGVSRQFVDAVEKGVKRPPASLLRALGLEEVTFYKEIEDE